MKNSMRGVLVLLGGAFFPSACLSDDEFRAGADAAGEAGSSTELAGAGTRNAQSGGSSGHLSSVGGAGRGTGDNGDAGPAADPADASGRGGSNGSGVADGGRTDNGGETGNGESPVAGTGGQNPAAGGSGTAGEPSNATGGVGFSGGTGDGESPVAGTGGQNPAAGGSGTAGEPSNATGGVGFSGGTGGVTPGAGGSAGDHGETELGGGGSGGDGGAPGEELLGGHAGTGVDADLIGPTVVSVSPPSNASGVAHEVPLVVQFSEPMNQDSVESALSISGGVSEDLRLVWNADATTLTVSPTTGWAYASGTDPDLSSAQTYTVVLTTATSDLAGNELATDWSSTFSTLRQITETLRPTTMLRYDSYQRTARECPTTESFDVGFLVTSSATVHKRGLFGFDGSILPSDVAEIESVVLTVRQLGSTAGYYSTGTVEVEARGRESFEVGDTVSQHETVELGTILDDAGDGQESLDITQTVLSYWPDEQFYQLSDNDNSPDDADAVISCAINLSFQYLVP